MGLNFDIQNEDGSLFKRTFESSILPEHLNSITGIVVDGVLIEILDDGTVTKTNVNRGMAKANKIEKPED